VNPLWDVNPGVSGEGGRSLADPLEGGQRVFALGHRIPPLTLERRTNASPLRVAASLARPATFEVNLPKFRRPSPTRPSYVREETAV
jgi:hypothetical protein